MTDRIIAIAAKIDATAGKRPRLDIMAYSGGIMRVEGFGPVLIDLAGLTLPARVPLLGNHENALDAVLGSGKPTVMDGKLIVTADLVPDAPATRQVLALLGAGVSLQASVGVAPSRRRLLAEGEVVRVNGRSHTIPAGGATLITEGALKEVSLVAIGADSSTHVSLAARYADLQENRMRANPVTVEEEQTQDSTEQAVLAERERISAIYEASEGFPELRASAISGAMTLDTLKSRVAEIKALRDSRPAAPTIMAGRGGVTLSHEMLSAGLMIRAGFGELAAKCYGDEVASGARAFRHTMDIVEASYEVDRRTSPQTKNEMIRGAFGVSTLAMPTALTEAGNRILLEAYQQSPATWRKIAKVVNLANFKPTKVLRPNLLGPVERVAPGGEVKRVSADETLFSTIQADTFAALFSVDRRDLINDDLGSISQLSEAMGPAAARGLNDLFARVLLGANGGHFVLGNNLLSGAESLMSLGALEAAVALMRKQTGKNGENLDLAPSVLAVPPELEFIAKAIIASTEVRVSDSIKKTTTPTGNPLQGIAEVVVEPRLSNPNFAGASSTLWFLSASPRNAPMHVGFIDGQEYPMVEFFDLSSDAEQLSVTWRVVFDYAVALGDPKALVKSDGA